MAPERTDLHMILNYAPRATVKVRSSPFNPPRLAEPVAGLALMQALTITQLMTPQCNAPRVMAPDGTIGKTTKGENNAPALSVM